MKVVMIDDSPADRRLYEILLADVFGSGLQFWGASSGAAGIDLCKSVRPDCVLLEYRLPDMTGLEFMERIQRDEVSDDQNFATVMLTGFIDEQIAIEALRAGAQDYLVKDGITPERLTTAIQRATEKIGLIRTLKQERDRLAAFLSEKEVLLKEIHHRVKNNLQVIASLLRLQADACIHPDLAAALQESQNRVESMALVHEQLYVTNDLREIDLAKQTELLTANLFHCYGDPPHVSCESSMQPLMLGVDQAIPVSLILNELISNSLKHAFPHGRSGTVRIEGAARDGHIVLAVSDDGAGMSHDMNARLPKSLGLEIVKILTAQLKGELEVDRTNGTRVRITFPQDVSGTGSQDSNRKMD